MKLSNFLLILGLFLFITVCDGEQINWQEQAEFYASNYPDCTSNEKALMLIDSMKNAGEKPVVVEKIYKVRVIYVYDRNGRKIFPVKWMERKKGFRALEETVKELDSFGRKKKGGVE